MAPGIVTHTYNPSIQEVEAERSGVQGYAQLLSEFEASATQ